MGGDFSKYARQISLEGFGADAQEKLAGSKIVLVGAGGIGSAALPLLVGAGVGNIALIDCDTVSKSNLHRQTIYAFDEEGRSKAAVAAGKMRKLNPDTNVEPLELLLESHMQLLPILEDADLCIDATDNFFARFLISDACSAKGVNEISASAEGWVCQLVCFGQKFNMRAFLSDESAAGEKSQGLPIFGPAASMAGVLAAGLALRVLTGIERFDEGRFERYSFENNRHLKIKL